MNWRKIIKQQGDFLFRVRSYFPIVFIPLFFIALRKSEYSEFAFGKTAHTIWGIFCVILSFCGLAIRCFTVGYTPRGTSGRNTRCQTAEHLNTTGMYSIVRHPLYLSNIIITTGIFLFVEVWWFIIIGLIGCLLYHKLIIFSEEAFLRNKWGRRWVEWSKKTPLLWPNFKNWRKPNLPFSFKSVLRGEHSTLFSIVAAYTFIDIAADLLAEKKLEIELGWMIFFAVGLLLYLTLRILKKKTRILDVAGRAGRCNSDARQFVEPGTLDNKMRL
ncbi:MAG: methyltransferase [Candidatus Omnitrophota bacterium]